jgi:hypothetical protein
MNVIDLDHHTPSDQLWGHFRVQEIDSPQIKLIGWALGRTAQVKQIEIISHGDVIARTALDRPRPDIAEEFPTTPAAATCGFEITIEALGDGENRLQIQALLDDRSEAQLGMVRVASPRRRWWAGLFGRGT